MHKNRNTLKLIFPAIHLRYELYKGETWQPRGMLSDWRCHESGLYYKGVYTCVQVHERPHLSCQVQENKPTPIIKCRCIRCAGLASSCASGLPNLYSFKKFNLNSYETIEFLHFAPKNNLDFSIFSNNLNMPIPDRCVIRKQLVAINHLPVQINPAAPWLEQNMKP